MKVTFLFNIATIGLDDGHEPLAEGLAHLLDVGLVHVVPVLVDGGLELVNIGMADGAGLGLDMQPECAVERVGVRGVWRPYLLGPEGEDVGILLKEGLDLVDRVSEDAALLEDYSMLTLGNVSWTHGTSLGARMSV